MYTYFVYCFLTDKTPFWEDIMGMLVEARRRKGEFVYRLWSTGGDVYATEPRDGGMMRLTLLRDSVFKALDEFGGGSESGAEKRMERARAHGTSSTERRKYICTCARGRKEVSARRASTDCASPKPSRRTSRGFAQRMNYPPPRE